MGKPVVIGLGGGGSDIVEELRDSLSDLSNLITLDLDSEVFGGFFMGYCVDVFPIVQQWVGLATQESFETWFNRRGHFSPLRDLPEIFARCTTRPIMRAALLMHANRLRVHLAEILDSPEDVSIVCQTNGATGSAWVLDIAEMVKDLSPNARVRIVLVDGRRENFGNGPSLHQLSNSYWTIREASSHEQFAKDSILFRTRLNASEYLSRKLRGIEDPNPTSEVEDTAAFQFGCAREIYSLNHSMGLDRFLEGRCRPVSALITESSRQALAGLLVAHAENRVEKNSERKLWDVLLITARGSDSMSRITVPHIESPGASFISLALTDRGFGDQVHLESITALQSEGEDALNDPSFVVTDDSISLLQEIRSQTLQRLDHSAESGLIGDVYPVLLELLDSLLKRHMT